MSKTFFQHGGYENLRSYQKPPSSTTPPSTSAIASSAPAPAPTTR